MMPMGNPFWETQCPARGVGLTHVHSKYCSAQHTGHVSDECCECNQRAGTWRPSEPVTPVVRDVTKDHPYKFTMAGRCGECQGLEDDHPIFMAPDPMTGCDVDHRSITSKRLIGDEGEVWSTCPRCGVMIEPGLGKGEAVGPRYGKGRMPFTARHWEAIVVLRDAFKGGYFKS